MTNTILAMLAGALFSLSFTLSSREPKFWLTIATCALVLAVLKSR